VFGDKEVARDFVYLMQTTEGSEEGLKALMARVPGLTPGQLLRK